MEPQLEKSLVQRGHLEFAHDIDVQIKTIDLEDFQQELSDDLLEKRAVNWQRPLAVANPNTLTHARGGICRGVLRTRR